MAPILKMILPMLLMILVQSTSGNWLKNLAKPKTVVLVDALTEPLHNTINGNKGIPYSVPKTSQDYRSSTKFQARGMSHLYQLTEMFMNFVQSKEAFPEGLIFVKNKTELMINWNPERDWETIGRHYGPALLVLVGAILYIALMPVFGVIFCFCQCVDRCGSRTRQVERLGDPVRRYLLNILLSGIFILISFGVVCAFVTNESVDEESNALPEHLKVAIRDVDLYLNNTRDEVLTLTQTNYREMEFGILQALENSGKRLSDKLAVTSKANALYNLTGIVNQMEDILKELNTMNSITHQLQDEAALLKQAILDSKEILRKKLNMCRLEPACSEFTSKYPLDDLDVDADFTKIPNVTKGIKDFTRLKENGIEKEVRMGVDDYRRIESDVNAVMAANIAPVVKTRLEETGKSMFKHGSYFELVIEEARKLLKNHPNEYMQLSQQPIMLFNYYRYHIVGMVNVIMVIILLCLGMGLCYGFFGGRPGGDYHEQCCNRGSGAQWLLMTVWFMFMFSWMIMSVALTNFITGMSAENVICKPARDPANSRIFSMVDEMVNLEKIFGVIGDDFKTKRPFTLSRFISNCHKNGSLYEVLEMDTERYSPSFDSYASTVEMRQSIEEMASYITFDGKITLLNNKAYSLLMELRRSKFFDMMFDNISLITGQISKIDLSHFSEALNETAYRLPDTMAEIRNTFRVHSGYLRLHQSQQLTRMKELALNLEEAAARVEQHKTYNSMFISQAIQESTDMVYEAQEFLYNRGQDAIVRIAKQIGNEIMDNVDEYFSKVAKAVTMDIGRCWPLAQAYDSLVVAGCDKMLKPYNGYWMSIGAVALLYLPAIIVALVLARLNQKTKGWSYDDIQYLNDVGDNIPMADVPAERKNNKPRNRTRGHGSGAGVRKSVADAPACSHNDSPPSYPLSPTHNVSPLVSVHNAASAPPKTKSELWNFESKAGVPLPMPPPEEYERPPPYYFPGPESPTSSQD